MEVLKEKINRPLIAFRRSSHWVEAGLIGLDAAGFLSFRTDAAERRKNRRCANSQSQDRGIDDQRPPACCDGGGSLERAPSLGTNPLDRGIGFGFTGSVVVDSARGGSLRSAGSFGWGGAAGTFFWIDPKEDMTVFLFTLLMVPPYELHSRLDVLANQAIAD